MPTYNVVTDAPHDALLAWIVSQYNLEHDTTLTKQQYISLRFPQLLAPYAAQFDRQTRVQIGERYANADAATQAQVKTLLGI